MRLFVENPKGYTSVYENVYGVMIRRADKKQYLEIKYNSLKASELILLSEIRLCFLIDVDTMHEYFRYQK